MYELTIDAPLSILHKMDGTEGREGILHGHDLQLGILVRYASGPEAGRPTPFTEVQNLLGEELDPYRSQILNRMPDFQGTAVLLEDLARVLFERLSSRMEPLGLDLARVEVVDNLNRVRISYSP